MVCFMDARNELVVAFTHLVDYFPNMLIQDSVTKTRVWTKSSLGLHHQKSLGSNHGKDGYRESPGY